MGLKAIDLFCGAGGFSLGLCRAGFEVVLAVDSWDLALRTHARNFAHPCVEADLAQASASSLSRQAGRSLAGVDLVVGGPPCQGFSVQRIGDDIDDRNEMVSHFARLVNEFRPKMFLMENVKGLLGRRGASLVFKFERAMRESGYDFHHAVLDAANYGVPQIRKRVFYCGWLRGEVRPFAFPKPAPLARHQTVRDAIGDLPLPAQDRIGATDPLHVKMRLSDRNLERLKLIPPGGGFEDLPFELRVLCHRAGAAKIGHRNVYGRLDAEKPAATITARFDSFTRGRFAHPEQHRNISLREGARLQTFDDSFNFEGSQEQVAALIGNAVPPLLAETLARALYGHLEGNAESELSMDKEQPLLAF